MVQLLNSIYLGAATPSDYGKAAGVVELLPFDYYLGAAVPSHGKPTINVLLSGVSPLTLLNAVKLNYVKAFGKCEQDSETYIDSVTLDGKCEQDGTPTPTSPVDIVANNGTIKVRHQSGLPLGYQPYEYITASGTQWLDTGVKLASTDVVEAEFQNSSTTGYGALYGVYAMGDSSAFYANGTYYGYNVSNGKVDTNVSVDTAWHTLRFDYANGVITLDGNDTTYTPFVFDNAKNNYLFARYYSNSYGYGFKGSCKRFKVIRNGVLICDLIPVVQLSDDAIGMYDLVNNVFYGNVGTGDFTATNPINDLEVYYDGTVETATDNVGNVATAQPLLSVGDYKDTQEVLSGAVTRNVGIKVLDGTETWYSNEAQGVTRFYCMQPDAYNISGGSTRYQLFITHFGFAITGQVRGIGFLFTGKYLYFIPTDETVTTVTQWTNWVKAQYAAGTPVIVVYPLDTAITESVSGQVLNKEPVTVTGSLTGLVANVVSSTHTVPKPTQPLDIVCNNGVLKASPNLFNPATAQLGDISSVTGGISANDRRIVSDFIPIEPNTAYVVSGTFSINDEEETVNRLIYAYYDANQDYVGGSRTATGTGMTSFTTPNDSTNKYMRVVYFSTINTGTASIANSKLQLELGSTATTYRPYGSVYYDGTAETVQAHGKNLFTTTGETKDKFLNSSGVEQNGVYENYQFSYTDYLPVLPNTEYTFSVRQVVNNTLLNHRIHEYTENKTWIKQGANLLTQSGGTLGGVVSATFTTSATTKWLRINYVYNPTGEMPQLELGSTATTYVPYFEGTTATCQPLLSVGDYKDVQNITNGAITKNVRIQILDGTEDWTQATTSLGVYRYRFEPTDAPKLDGGRGHCISTHFFDIGGVSTQDIGGVFAATTFMYFIPNQDVDTVAKWTTYLASQYNAGTPVIVVYPLKTATTETVTGQTLTITQGTNIVTAEGSVDDLELEISYKGYAELTVEEIEAVNTDESVEVIIS